MSSVYFAFAVLLTVSQLSQASFPYYYGEYPALGYYGIAESYPYYPYAAYGYGAYPYGYPFGLHSHHYHPRTALRNVAKSFQREEGHLSETDMISPFAKKN
ncbi:hypothetical protein Y032_0042g647 [Ancylostoma ceylanicum]|uniref:Sulfur globule protein CV3 domain protein n=1 Tax=Ancylostoma ceylanicum TaxID=53326 RepID=A0A016UGN6_9BILA|nr:hypothetical protein Y032_0042g647 [Ancylostoma ceylanicum]